MLRDCKWELNEVRDERDKRDQQLHSRLDALKEAQKEFKEQEQAMDASDATKKQEVADFVREIQFGYLHRDERNELVAAQYQDIDELERRRAALVEEDQRIRKESEELKGDVDENGGVFR